VERVLQRLYGDDTGSVPPREVLVSHAVEEPALAEWLSGMRGSRVSLRLPKRGDKRALMATAVANAEETLRAHTARRSSDLTTRSQALRELQEALSLAEPPLRIECIDISTLQGQDTVASLVVFEDGLPRTSDYRTFAIRGERVDDLAAMGEVVGRRFRERDEPVGDRFAYPPALLVVDGGAPQARAAQDALMAAGMGELPVVGLAKRLEEVWLPDRDDPVILPRTSEGLYLLQRVRDEAHRTAIAFHRRRRGRRATSSALDGVPGLGPSRIKALLAQFGSVRRLAEATPEELAAVPGIGPRVAAAVHAALADREG
jgi:excinuclease ABC subunit C